MSSSTPEGAAADATSASSRTSRALALLSDHWTLNILQQLFLGRHKYQEIRDEIQISDSILANRLKTLVEGGLLTKSPYRDGRIRYEYRLTPAGKATWRIYVAAWIWECDWLNRRDERHPELIHRTCGHEARPLLVCGKCDGEVTTRSTTITRATDRLYFVGALPRRHRQARTLELPQSDDLQLRQETMEVLGDRWNTALASAAVIGIRRFTDFERFLGIPPTVLSARLARFVELGLLYQQELAGGSGRTDYRLTPKGTGLAGILLQIVRWSDENIKTGEISTIEIRHDDCGRKLQPEFACAHCREHLRRTEIRWALPRGGADAGD